MSIHKKPVLLADGSTARFALTGVLESATKQNGKPYTKLTATWSQVLPDGSEQAPITFLVSALLYQDGSKPNGQPRMRGLETGRKGLSGMWPFSDWKAAMKGAGWNNRPGDGFSAERPMLVKVQLVPANEPYPARNVPLLFSPCQASEEMAGALDDLMGDGMSSDVLDAMEEE